MLPREDLKLKLQFCFRVFETTLRTLGKQGLFHRHIQSEAIFRDLLNLAFGTNLECLPINTPAIDLYEWETGLCYQITTVDTNYKKTDTIKKLEKLVAEGKVKKVTRLVILTLNTDEKKLAEQLFSGEPKHDFDVEFLNLEDLSNQICLNAGDDPRKIDALITFLYDYTGVFYFFKQLEVMEPTTPPENSYLFPGYSRVPIAAGTYWGIDRTSYVGIYISLQKESMLFTELVASEKLIIESIEGQQIMLPERRWFNLSVQQVKDPDATLKDFEKRHSCFAAMPENETIGLLVNFRVDPSRFSAYGLDFSKWSKAFRLLEEKHAGSVAMIFNVYLPDSSSDIQELIAHYKKEILRDSAASNITVLVSQPEKPVAYKAAAVSNAVLFGLPDTRLGSSVLETTLEHFFLYMVTLLQRNMALGNANELFWPGKPACTALCANNLTALAAARQNLEKGKSADLIAMLDGIKKYCTYPAAAKELYDELLIMASQVSVPDGVMELFDASIASVSSSSRAALDFALLQDDMAYLDHWTFRTAKKSAFDKIYLQRHKAEKLILSILKIVNITTGLAEAEMGRLNGAIDHYSQFLPTEHIYHQFIVMSRSPELPREYCYATIDRLSMVQTYQFVQAGLYQRLDITVNEILSRVGRTEQPGFFWKMLFFSRSIEKQYIRELLNENSLQTRAMIGLCSKAEIKSMQHLITLKYQ